MKTSYSLRAFLFVVLGAMICLATPAFGQASEDLNKALDLVHQALNPGGDPPTDAQRTDLLTQALTFISQAHAHHTQGHRKQAQLDIHAALDELAKGDPDKKATGLIHDAYLELRSAASAVD